MAVTAYEVVRAIAHAARARAAVFAVVAAEAPVDALLAGRTGVAIRAQAHVAGSVVDVAHAAVEAVVAGERADARVHLVFSLAAAPGEAEGTAAQVPSRATRAAVG